MTRCRCARRGFKWTSATLRLAVLMVGHADGFRRAPIIGRGCMDMIMAAVTDIEEIKDGDEVVLIGRQGEEQIRAEEVAALLGTSN